MRQSSSRLSVRLCARYALLGLLAFSLPACDYFNPPPPAPKQKPVKRAKPAKKIETPAPNADAYISSLTLARIALAATPPDSAALAPQLELLQAGADAKKRKTETQTIVILKYDGKSAPLKQVIAPIPSSTKETQYASLNAVMAAQGRSATLYDVSIGKVTITPEPIAEHTDGDTAALSELLARRQQQLTSTAIAPDVLDNIRKQMSLVRFFIASRYRDAAYIAMDNMKKLLGEAPSSEETKQLSGQLDELEQQLRKVMPYTLP